MPYFICTTCGTQYAETDEPPASCPICLDERQYVKATGQQWTVLDQLRRSHHNSIRLEEPNLIGIGIEPHFAIGQRAMLVRTPSSNILWDCVALLDEGVVEMIEAMGGISAIAISHPHYYTSMVEWSRAFGAPIYLHSADRQWVMRPDNAIVFWDEETEKLSDGLTLVRCGGHFEGGTILHWPDGADGKGALLTGDILQVAADCRHVSFMWSYPNYIPLPAGTVKRIAQAVKPLEFERVHGAFWDRVIQKDGKTAVQQSVDRYLRAMAGDEAGG